MKEGSISRPMGGNPNGAVSRPFGQTLPTDFVPPSRFLE